MSNIKELWHILLNIGKTVRRIDSEAVLFSFCLIWSFWYGSKKIICKQLGTTERTIEPWKNGEADIYLSMVVKLADFYKVFIDELVKGSTEVEW